MIAVKGTMITAKRRDHEITRNSSDFKVVSDDIPLSEHSDDDSEDGDHDRVTVQPEAQLQQRYPLRDRKPPERLMYS